MHFKLFADCMPVKGVVRSAIYDLGQRDFKLIPNELYDILTEHHSKTVSEAQAHYKNKHDDTIDEYFAFLIEHEFAFYCTEEELALFPPLPREFDLPATVSNAIVDSDSDSKHDYKAIFAQLAALQCKFVQLRFYQSVSYQHFRDIITQTLDKNIRGIDVVLPFTEEFCHEHIVALIVNFPLVKLELYSFDEIVHDKRLLEMDYDIPVLFTKTKVAAQTHCGVVDPIHFQVNKDLFLESLQFNSCLNRKNSIDAHGNIKNCPSMPQSYGNIKNVTLVDALQKQDFKEV